MSDAEQPDLPPTGPCQPCRATGRVISNLGGTPSERPCPWCEGTGVRIPGQDAQAAWREQAAAPAGD